MTTLTMRQKLITYLADADDSKVNALYTLLEKDIDEDVSFLLTEKQIKFLDEEHDLYMSGKGKSYTREESFQIIKGQREF